MRDLKNFCPEINSSSFYPGDVAVISKEGVQIERGKSDFVKIKEEDGYKVEFKPVLEVPPLRTQTNDKEEHEKQLNTVVNFIEKQFLDEILKKKAVRTWVEWQVVYQLEVFGQNDSQIWCLDFAGEDASIIRGRVGKINLYEGIGCSEFYRLINNDTSCCLLYTSDAADE